MTGLGRTGLRTVIFLLAAACAFPWADHLPVGSWTPPDAAKAVLPRLSSLLNLFGSLAGRQVAGWSILLGVPLLVLAFFRGRVFCWRICPMGFAAELAGRLNPRGKGLVRRVPALNRALALVIVVAAVCGYPLVIWLDPLSIFNGFFAAWRLPFAWTAGAMAIGFVSVLVLCLAVPNVWCHRLCPLGGLQEAVMDMGRRWRARRETAGRGKEVAPKVLSGTLARRTLLAGLPAAVASVAVRRSHGAKATGGIRPPGADLTRFNALCARCGNCMTACPYHLIHPDFGETGVEGFLSPVLHLRSACGDPEMDSYCFHDCVKCTQVCPTGALRPLDVLAKHATPIGLAVIDRTKCLAWAKNEYCVVCDEYCPYKAVKIEIRGEVSYPSIIGDKCRGCGACEAGCPADPIAVRVRPLQPREIGRKLLPSEIDSPEKALKGDYQTDSNAEKGR